MLGDEEAHRGTRGTRLTLSHPPLPVHNLFATQGLQQVLCQESPESPECHRQTTVD